MSATSSKRGNAEGCLSMFEEPVYEFSARDRTRSALMNKLVPWALSDTMLR